MFYNVSAPLQHLQWAKFVSTIRYECCSRMFDAMLRFLSTCWASDVNTLCRIALEPSEVNMS